MDVMDGLTNVMAYGVMVLVAMLGVGVLAFVGWFAARRHYGLRGD